VWYKLLYNIGKYEARADTYQCGKCHNGTYQHSTANNCNLITYVHVKSGKRLKLIRKIWSFCHVVELGKNSGSPFGICKNFGFSLVGWEMWSWKNFGVQLQSLSLMVFLGWSVGLGRMRGLILGSLSWSFSNEVWDLEKIRNLSHGVTLGRNGHRVRSETWINSGPIS
jgi:hypothetical protein